MPRRSPPKYARHSSGQARVRVDGKVVYLGEYGSADSHARYAAIVAKWLASNGPGADRLTVGELTVAYLEHVRRHYVKNGDPTTEVFAITDALRRLNRLSRSVRVTDLSPRHLKAYQSSLIADGLSRNTINGYCARVRRMVKWARSEELVPKGLLEDLKTVTGLQAGRTAAREPEPIKPVPLPLVDAIEPYVSPAVWGLIRFQLVTGARPGEAIIVRGCDLNMTGAVWEYRPARHKLEHKDIDRVVMIGPQGQAVLREFLRPELQAYLFSPDPDGRRPYRRDSYALAIKRGCELAFGMPEKLRTLSAELRKLPEKERAAARKRDQPLLREAAAWRAEHCWHPNQLRHNFGTSVRRQAGLEASRVTLGHASVSTTEIYAERDLEAARAVAAKIG